MGEMTAYDIEELVSQAESIGVTLADVFSSKLSAEDMERMQQDLTKKMAENYKAIEGFMADVEVPSLADLSNLSDTDLDEIQGEIIAALSDDVACARP